MISVVVGFFSNFLRAILTYDFVSFGSLRKTSVLEGPWMETSVWW